MNRTSTRWLSPVAELLRRSRDEPGRVALVAEGRAWSCAQLAAASARVAAGLLGRGVGVGDRVALHLYNTSDAVLALLACLRIGAVAVPMNTQLTTPELRDLLNRTRPVLYLGEQDLSAPRHHAAHHTGWHQLATLGWRAPLRVGVPRGVGRP
jgi:acyl-CoA synthetase (AMP-forming)/AMP-acid ligase II